MKKIVIYSVVLLFLISSCQKKKDLPLAEIAENHFYVKCDMDGSPFDIRAGDEDYYMNPSWYHDDGDNVYVYKGNLAKQTGAGYQVTILINDFKKTEVNGLMHTDSALMAGEHLFNDNNSSGLTQNVTFKPVKDLESAATYSWTVTDGLITKHIGSGEPGKEYCISRVFKAGKTYSVTLNYSNGNGTCDSEHSNVFKAGSAIQTTVTAKRNLNMPGLTYDLDYEVPYQNGSWKCLWKFPDGTTSNDRNPQKSFKPGKYTVQLNLTDDAVKDSCSSYYQLNVSDVGSCDANYTAQFSPIQNSRLYASVTILVTDPNGLVYSSKDLVQPQASNFEILEVGEYTANDSGQPTKRLKVKFNCIVKNGAREINLNNGEAIIGVAYK